MADPTNFGVYTIPAPQPEEDAVSDYQDIATAREDNDLDQWIANTVGTGASGDQGGSVADGAALDAKGGQGGLQDPATFYDRVRGEAGLEPAAEAGDREAPTSGAVIKDIAHGIVEAPGQVFGGAVDAIDEVGQFLGELTGLGGIQFFDEDAEGNLGDFNPKLLSFEEFQAVGGGDLIAAITTKPADSVTGGFVRATSQFLVGFIPALKGVKTMKALQGSKIVAPMVAGMIADAVVFDPHEDRLSTFLNEIPSLEPFVSDYLADSNPENESSWEGRMKNAIEGIGMGLTAEAVGGLIRGFKYYKAQRAMKFIPDEVGANAEAGRDAFQMAAREELVVEIPDEALHPLGDVQGPMLVEGDVSETAGTAIQRVAAAERRAALSIEQNDALGKINAVREAVTEAADEGVDGFDEMINRLRSGGAVAGAADTGGKRPVASIVKELGGVEPGSSLAAELKARGVTARTHPGLFRKGGLTALDNIPVEEQPIFSARNLDDGQGFVPEQSFVDALESEAAGDPWLTIEQQRFLDEEVGPLADLDEQLQRLDIDVAEMSNSRVKERLQEIADEEAAFARTGEVTPEGAEPITLADLTPEEAARAEADIDGLGATPEGKIYINHARINSSDDVRAVLQEMADLDADAINARRGGDVVTNEQTIAASSQEYRDMSDLLGRDPGPMTASQSIAARKLLTASGEQIVELARRASAADASKADVYNFRRSMAVHYAIQSEVIAARSETARALQAWAIPVGADSTRSQMISELVMNDGGAGNIQSLAKAVATVGDNPTALNTMARELGKGRFGKALYQVWINGLLSGLKTDVVNMTSNSLVAAWAIPERYVAAGISKAFYNGEITVGEVAAKAYGTVKGIRDGFNLIFRANEAEGMEGLADVFQATGGKMRVHGNAISADALGLDVAGSFGRGIDMVGKAINLPGTMLEIEDRLFKAMGYRSELNALAFRRVTAEGLEGTEAAERIADILLNPPTDLRIEAIDAAHYQTFTKELGETGQAFQTAVRKIPGGRLVFPFVRTATNIVKYTLERTPLAYISAGIRADIKAGGTRAATAHARVAMGSMLMMVIADMTNEGTVTGRGPSKYELSNLRRGTGWMPYSVKVDGRWVSYSRLDPIGMMMGIGADMAEIMNNKDEDEDSAIMLVAGVAALANNLANKTYMTGFYDFIGAIDPSNPSKSIERYLINFSGTLMPFSSLMRSITQATDPIVRDIRVPKQDVEGEVDAVGAFLGELINKQRSMIPGLSDDLPPRQDLWGEEIDRSSGLGIAYDFLSPIASHVDEPDAVVQVMLDNQVAISNAPRAINGVQLTPEEYSEFVREAGQPLKEYLDKLVVSPGFKGLSDGPDGMKAEVIRDVVNNFRTQAKALMIQRNPRLQELIYMRQLEKAQTLQGGQ